MAADRSHRLLDLFCGAGGAAVGYHRAGFDVVGVDITPQPHYPFEVRQGDALAALERALAFREMGMRATDYDLEDFDAIHASPPCQHYSDLSYRNGNASDHPDLIPATRRLLRATGLPYVIENVEGAPLRDPVTLCGVRFPDLAVIRHRLFETNWPLTQPLHTPHPLCYTRDKRKAHYGAFPEDEAFVSVNGGGNSSVARAREAMGIDWMTKDELNEAIPPAYTEFIGRQLLVRMCPEVAA